MHSMTRTPPQVGRGCWYCLLVPTPYHMQHSIRYGYGSLAEVLSHCTGSLLGQEPTGALQLGLYV